jgi:hypothetical protein
MPFAPINSPKLPDAVAKARQHFYAGGWSYRSAAPHLGVSYQHLCQVLNGERLSRRLTAAVSKLPTRIR